MAKKIDIHKIIAIFIHHGDNGWGQSPSALPHWGTVPAQCFNGFYHQNSVANE